MTNTPRDDYEEYKQWKFDYVDTQRKKDCLYMLLPENWYWEKWSREVKQEKPR